MEEFNQFIGQHYSKVNEQLDAVAKDKGLTAFPWPEGIGGVARDEDSIIVLIKSDMDDVIVGFK